MKIIVNTFLCPSGMPGEMYVRYVCLLTLLGAPWVSPEASQRVLSPEPFLLSLSGPEDDASSVIVERVVETIGASQNGFPLIF